MVTTTNKINKFLSLAWHSAKKTLGNDHGWVQLAIAGIAAVGAIASALSQPGSNGAEFQNNTQSGNTINDVNFLFDVENTQAMTNLTQQMNDWSTEDRNYFKDVFEPFQQALTEGNKTLIPDIVANSGASLQSNLKSIMGGDMLQEAFTNLTKEAGGDVSKFSADFGQMVDQIPTAEQRVGQAVSGLEQQFGQAGAELKRQMGAKGMDVSEAGLRQMALGKATSKSSVTDQANQMARTEKLDALERGIGVQSAVQESQTSMLDASRKTTQAGADLTPQIGGVQALDSLSETGMGVADMTANMANKQIGQSNETKSATFAAKGMNTPRYVDPETGFIVGAGGDNWTKTNFDERNAVTDWKNSLSPEEYKKLNGSNGVVSADIKPKTPNYALDGGGPGVGGAGGSDGAASGGGGVSGSGGMGEGNGLGLGEGGGGNDGGW